MANFRSGLELDQFTQSECAGCTHWRDLGEGTGEGCPIIDIHTAFRKTTSVLAQRILDMLIYPDSIAPAQCLMWLWKEERDGTG